MPAFPLFIDLKGKRCVVVGGGEVAARKIQTLLEFDAFITVISPDISESIQELKWQGKVIVIKKRYSEDDIEGAFMVIAATSDEKVNQKVYNDALRSNIFVNMADCPEKCTFTFPSVVTRDDLVIGISTSGGYPALAKKLRQKIEGIIPECYGALLQVLKQCRIRAQDEIGDAAMRRELLNKVLDEVVFYEDAVTPEVLMARIEDMFGEYRDEKDNKGRDS